MKRAKGKRGGRYLLQIWCTENTSTKNGVGVTSHVLESLIKVINK
jgi:hypothetical protein